MKSLFSISLFLLVSTCIHAQAFQTAIPQRRIQFHFIGKDSIDLNLNDGYDMIEDSCAQIIRHGHLNVKERKFFGKFKDVSKLDPAVTVSEGFYTAEGLKDGFFIAHYLNGNLRSKGAYKEGKYLGKWETYFENGKPAMLFEAVGDTLNITDVWDADGKKIIEDGKGTYLVNLGYISWKGKLENGHPNGTWHAFKTDDATQTSIAEESFRKGKFQKGSSNINDYTDKSRIILIDPNVMAYARAEKLFISSVPCNGTKQKHIVNAQYENGLASFSNYISDLANPVISGYNIKQFVNDKLTLEGEVSEKGYITNLKSFDTFNGNFVRNMVRALADLPHLKPATADGRPVKQKFTITFNFNNQNGMYTFSYKFLPVQAN